MDNKEIKKSKKSKKKIFLITFAIIIVVIIILLALLFVIGYKENRKYENIEKVLNEHYFEIEIGNNEPVLYITSPRETLMFSINRDIKSTVILSYKSAVYKDYTLTYGLENKIVLGFNENCSYDLTSNYVPDDEYCSEDDKYNIKLLSYSFDDLLNEVGLSLDELIDFANYYYDSYQV